jgi:hypothetical protein
MMLYGISIVFNSLDDVFGLMSRKHGAQNRQVLVGFQSTESFGRLQHAGGRRAAPSRHGFIASHCDRPGTPSPSCSRSRWCRRGRRLRRAVPCHSRQIAFRKSYSPPQPERRDVDQHQVHRPAATPGFGLRCCPGRQCNLMSVVAAYPRAMHRNRATRPPSPDSNLPAGRGHRIAFGRESRAGNRIIRGCV